MDVIQNILQGVTIMAISTVEGDTARSRTTKWKNDLGALLRAARTPNVAVILNDDNIHYQYLTFKGPGDDDFHTVLDRQRFRDVLLADSASGPSSAALISVAQAPPVTITISSSPSSPSARARARESTNSTQTSPKVARI
jgi:hypothetical protein